MNLYDLIKNKHNVIAYHIYIYIYIKDDVLKLKNTH